MAQKQKEVEGESKELSPALAKKMQKALEDQGFTMQDFVKAFGMDLVAADDAPARETRISKREKYMTPRKLEGEDKKLISSLPKVVGSAIVPETDDIVPSQEMIDSWAGELLPVRESIDKLTGDDKRIREYVLNGITAKNDGDDMAPGQLVSIEHKTKLVKSVTEPKAVVNYDALEALVDEKTWKEITSVRRVPDEEKIHKALADGKLTFDTVRQITSLTKPVARFLVQPLRKGDELS